MIIEFDNIPVQLQQRKQWVLWKLEKRNTAQDKPTKVMYAINGKRASSTDSATWSSFQEVVNLFQQSSIYSGIGYVFSSSDPFTGIDLDSDENKDGFTCMHDGGLLGQLTDEAKAIVQQLNSYTEYSQSGAGLHIIVEATKLGQQCRTGNFEMYDQDRFFVMTGKHVEGTPLTIEQRQHEADALYTRFFGTDAQKEKASELTKPKSPMMSDETILSIARSAKNGAKFSALYDAGAVEQYGGDDSAADQALCDILAFYTQEVEQIDRLFRQSELMRDKWERADYRERTINKAIADLKARYSRENDADPPKFDTEDKGNAERLVYYFGSQLLNCAGAWYIWDGKRWAKDDTKSIKTFGMKLAELIDKKEYYPLWDSINENDQLAIMTTQPKDLTPEQRVLKARLDGLKRQAKLMRTDRGINAALSLAAALRAARAEELDADPWLLNVNNGTLDLRTGVLSSHSPAQLLTKLAPVDYIPNAPAPLWLSSLQRIFEDEQGQTRWAELHFLQKMLGYCLTGSVKEHAFFIFHGRRGRNGKGVINQAVEAIMGDYAQQIPADALLAKKTDGGGASPSIAKIRGARLVFAKETDRGRRLDEALIKSLTGGDSITARFLHQNEFTFQPTFKIVLETNYDPHVDGSDDGIWDRIKKLDFLRHFEEHERDKALGEKLQAEYAGILAWMVEGCRLWHWEGLQETAAMKAHKEQTRSDGDPVIAYADERILFNIEAWVGPKELYEDYENWSYRNNEHTFKKREFRIRLQAIADRKKHVVRWDGKDPTGSTRAVRGVSFRNFPQQIAADKPTVVDLENYRK